MLVVGFSSDEIGNLLAPLVAAGLQPTIGEVSDLRGGGWRLVISPPSIPGLDGMELVAMLRAGVNRPSLLIVGPLGELNNAIRLPRVPGIEYLATPFDPSEMVKRAFTLLSGECISIGDTITPAGNLIMSEGQMLKDLEQVHSLTLRRQTPSGSFVVCMRLDELERYRKQLGAETELDVWQQVAALASMDALADETVAVGERGDLLMLLPASSKAKVTRRVQSLVRVISQTSLRVGGQNVRFSPAIGYLGLHDCNDATQALARVREAADQAARHMDLHPVLWQRSKAARTRTVGPARAWLSRLRVRHLVLIQYAITMLMGLGLPFLLYWWLGTHGLDISEFVYNLVVVMLAFTAVSIWAEGFLAVRRKDPPQEPASPYPPASAIIAAYLPNEAPIIEATVEAFLRVQYPGRLQVVLAYNTPKDMPEIEARLRQIAHANPRFIPMRVQSSTSKAQNVNFALPFASGAFTAVFDADHQPDPECFRRAWRWISHGADVVQGHCFIRNGQASWVARMVAVEFEQIYCVSHPGRARLHGFGIFGGSNGYWRTDLLRELRMHGFMLTEDIDSSMRAVVRGRKIVSDPYLVSRELAPETMTALTKQRLRWAQGWLQISLKWVIPALRSPNLSVRQKIGMIQLLAWREIYPWVSMQIIPLVAWWAVREGSLWRLDFLVPLFVVTTLFTLATGPGQVLFTYQLSDPEIRKHKSWFWFYVVTSTLFYSGLKNAWNRIAHYKEWRGETAWVVTPRVQAKK